MELTCIVYILAKLMLAQEKQNNLPKVCVIIINMPPNKLGLVLSNLCVYAPVS